MPRPTGSVPAPSANRSSSNQFFSTPYFRTQRMKTKTIAALSILLCAATVGLAQQPTPLLTKSADQLIAVLKSDANRKEKADACRELAVLADERAVPVLAGLLADDEMSHM